MKILLLLIAAALLLAVDYCVAKEFLLIAYSKGWHERRYFWWSFFLGFIGYLMVAALPDRAADCPAGCPIRGMNHS